jgi:hypothetical protein
MCSTISSSACLSIAVFLMTSPEPEPVSKKPAYQPTAPPDWPKATEKSNPSPSPMRQKIYTIVAVLWCAIFPAGQHLLSAMTNSPDFAVEQGIAVLVTMFVFGLAAVLLDPKKNQKSTNPPRLRD